MKPLISILIFFLGFLSFTVLATSDYYSIAFADTIPPPPGSPDSLYGPRESCVSSIAIYRKDLAMGCNMEWKVNGIIQASDSGSMEVVWTNAGLHTIHVTQLCASGSPMEDSLEVMVYTTPIKPGNIAGDDEVCEFTSHTYTTTVGESESCEWYVAGELQASIDTFMIYPFGSSGDYLIEVWAVSDCGTSWMSSFLMVEVGGLAPEPPSPINGPEISCTGYTETYTTTVNNNEQCQWRIDNVLQSETTPSIDIDWASPGEHDIEVRAVSTCGSSNPTYLPVTIFEQASVYLGEDTSIFVGQTIQLDAGNEGSQYLWSTGDTNQTILVSESDTYSVEVSNFCGVDMDTILVDVMVGTNELGEASDLRLFCSNGSLIIETQNQKLEHVYIANLSGKTIYNGKAFSQFRLPANGAFIVVIRTDKTVYRRKILITNI